MKTVITLEGVGSLTSKEFDCDNIMSVKSFNGTSKKPAEGIDIIDVMPFKRLGYHGGDVKQVSGFVAGQRLFHIERTTRTGKLSWEIHPNVSVDVEIYTADEKFKSE